MDKAKIVVVEDEPDIQEVIEYNLNREGYLVKCIPNGNEGLKYIQSEGADLVLLDLMLPGMDGIEVCKQLKNNNKTKNIPIIMVTAKGEESDIVLGLGVGADDYVAKPFSPKELVARVKAALRRGQTKRVNGELPEITKFAGVTINATKYEVKIDDQPVGFTATEFRLLQYLASHPGRVFTREQLLKHAIGDHTFVVDRNIDVHIRILRKKLGVYRDFIKTVRGIGYRFEELED